MWFAEIQGSVRRGIVSTDKGALPTRNTFISAYGTSTGLSEKYSLLNTGRECAGVL